MSNLIQAQWEIYRNQVLSEFHSPSQKKEIKRAFFAGAQGMTIVYENTIEEGATHEQALSFLDDVLQEVVLFFKAERNDIEH